MKVVILQPSYVPWRGYFDQISRADLFIFYDDAQYDKHGWRNRNQIKTSQGKRWMTIPVHSKGVCNGIQIKDISIDWSKSWSRKHLNALTCAYSKTPYWKNYLPWLNTVYNRKLNLLADFTIETTIELSKILGISNTKFIRSSELIGISGHKTDRLIQILKRVGATHYISGPSAKDYIEREKFIQAGISLEFIQYDYQDYPQLHTTFEPHVTILDLLFMTGDNALPHITGCKKIITPP